MKNDKLHKLVSRYSAVSGNPAEFSKSMQSFPRKCFRVNTLKANVSEIRESFGKAFPIEPVPFCREAFFTSLAALKTSEHEEGLVYFQDAASLLPVLAINGELKKAGTVLDACAAPGSKSTHIASVMDNRGLLISNDSDYNRVRALRFNLEKSGAMNCLVTNHNLLKFPGFQFDVLLLDVPCSLEGTARKDPAAVKFWSEKKIRLLAKLQKRLILKAFGLLKPGGIMVYSTCTFAPEENEAVVSHLLENSDAKLVQPTLPGLEFSPGLEEWNGKTFGPEMKKCVRVWPHQNDTEGFFLAKVMKP